MFLVVFFSRSLFPLLCPFISYQVEGIVAIVRGEEEGGLSLVGFGVDSLVEVASGLLVLRHLLAESAGASANPAESGSNSWSSSRSCGGVRCMRGLVRCFESWAKYALPDQRNFVGSSHGNSNNAKLFSSLDAYAAERTITLVIGGLLGLLGVTAAIGASINLASGAGPHAALSALILSSASLSFMGVLWAFKVHNNASLAKKRLE